jgi:GrpB-like predicted nucleotidyltransferase (UPF0157 family)
VIEIAEYDEGWPERFAEVGARLRAGLGAVALRIDHIGSTAVPGLAAKPVVDVQVSVASFEPLAAYRGPLEAAGFAMRPGNADLTKRYFRESGGPRTHVHVRRAGAFGEQLSLLLRDFLRTSPEDAERYGSTKRQLAATCADRRGYTAAKAPLVWELVQRAHAWSQQHGWHPGPTDA